MDTILVLLGLVALAIPLAVIGLLIGHGRLRRRLAELERRVAQMAPVPVPSPVKQAAAPVEVVAEAVRAEAEVVLDPVVSPAEPAPAEPDPSAPASPWDRATKSAGQTADPVPPAMAAQVAPDQNRPLVMRADRVSALTEWLKLNWVYALSALSLALAGVFFVQYGVENGLLPPVARVSAALIFGAILLAVGEGMRRRTGDEGPHRSALLPSVFSGAGLVSIFAAILAARQLYGLIGPEMAFAGHLLTAALAVVLGWFYGPLLVSIGLLGAASAPFIVAGGQAAGPWLYGYFALIAAVGLAVDAVRRWAWVSVLALVLGYGGCALLLLGGAGAPGWIAAMIGLVVLATVLPLFQLVPRLEGMPVVLALTRRAGAVWPPFPARLAAGAMLASVLGLLLMAGQPEGEAMLALLALTLLALAYVLWAERAGALVDLAYLPGLGFVISLILQGFDKLPIQGAYLAQAIDLRGPETAAPATVSFLLLMAAAMGAAFAWRSFRPGPLRMADTGMAALLAPVTAATLDLLWQPGRVIGVYPWALHIIALAAAMVVLTLRYAKADGAAHRRFAWATLSAMSLIALALFLVATSVALTLALAVLVVVAAGLDRRFDLPEMRFFIQIGAAVLWFRLFGNPGIDWAMIAPLGQVLLAFGGVIAAFVAALWLLAPRDRPSAEGVLESAAAGLAAVLLNVLLTRYLIPQINADGLETYWGASVNAMPWSILMLLQLYRVRFGGPMRRVRQAIALVAAFIAGGGLVLAAVPLNPLFVGSPTDPQGAVQGMFLLDSIALAYALPGILLLVSAWFIPDLDRRLRTAFFAVGAFFLTLYVGLEIRRYWEGNWLGKPGIVQGELYSYTVALMLVGAGLLYLAILRRSGLIRRIAMAVITLVIVKVFVLDVAGLNGLIRVASLLGLGLSLAGLAWLNRWAGQVGREQPSD